MPSASSPTRSSPPPIGAPLRLILVGPFVLLIFSAVGTIGYLSFRNGQQAVGKLANQLNAETSGRVVQQLDAYLHVPHTINQVNVAATELGELDTHDPTQLERHFWTQVNLFPSMSYIYLGTEAGLFSGAEPTADGPPNVGYWTATDPNLTFETYATDNSGRRQGLQSIVENYTLPVRPWYLAGKQASGPIWGDIYVWTAPYPNIALPAVQPFSDANGDVQGVFAVDLSLLQISDFLNTLEVGLTGEIFIVERSGLLVASSDPDFEPISDQDGRLAAADSDNQLIRNTAEFIQDNLGGYAAISEAQQHNFTIGRQQEYLTLTPYRDEFGLDWLIGVVVPEDDFMAAIHASTRTTIQLSIVALGIATIVGLLTARWISRPIDRLNQASLAIANGKLDKRVTVRRIHELKALAQSFNRMAQQLQESFANLDKTNKALEETNQNLELRVVERTAELSQAKDDADRANHAKSEFLANMSHELRTPLNAVLGFTQVMKKDASLTADQRNNLGIISRSGEHLLSLINDVLDMSKIEAGRMSLTQISFDLFELLSTIEDMLRMKAEAKGLTFSIEFTPEVPQFIKTDAKKLRQVLLNLLGNAIKFTEQGTVALSVDMATSGSHQLTFMVADTGVGIAAEEIKLVFSPFMQTESGRNQQQGTGLGLPISRQFVQLMGGDITIRSTPGEGTIFEFDISYEPTSCSTSVASEPERTVIGLVPGQPKFRVLAVDDRWENRQLLRALLEPVGFEVEEAANGQEAVERWESWEPHLIWMDMRMPILNGYEATKQIKSHLRGQATVIIALTASTFEEERGVVLSAGCDDFVRKPFPERIIWEKIEHYLGVKFIYDDDSESTTSSHSSMPDREITPSALTVMTDDWLTALSQAATELDCNAISQLIEQIPAEHEPLARALTQKVDDFDFDLIVSLSQQAVAS